MFVALRLRQKIFLIFLTTSFGILLLTTMFSRYAFQSGFVDYINAKETERIAVVAYALERGYERQGNWDWLLRDPRQWERITSLSERRPPPKKRQGDQSPRSGPPARPGERRRPPGSNNGPPPPGHILAIGQRIGLYDTNGQLLIGRPQPEGNGDGTALFVADEFIGSLHIQPASRITAEIDRGFMRSQTRSLAMVSAGLLLIAVVIAWLIARQMTQPVRRLVTHAHSLTAGDYDARLRTQRQDEFGDLSDDLNILADTLQKNRIARRQMIADVSHELRTPLTILKGELEALDEGVRQYTPDTQKSLRAEVERLQRLVEDLYELALTDLGGLNYVKSSTELKAIVENVTRTMQERFASKSIESEVTITAGPTAIHADSQRIEQLLVNLLENSIRHTDPGGRVRIRCFTDAGFACVQVDDSPPGVPRAALDKLFDRMYRVDESRSRGNGGAGLGLAICRNIVVAHSGTIEAAQSDLGGLRITARIPLLNVGAR